MQWAKPGGILGFTLDARIILMQHGTFRAAREALIQACSVTGILNGSCLEETAVWPGMKKPFIAFFARNEAPVPGHSFVLVTPIRENALSNRGEFRLDYTSAQAIHSGRCPEIPLVAENIDSGYFPGSGDRRKTAPQLWGQYRRETWGPPFSSTGFIVNPRDIDRKAPDWLLNLPFFKVPGDGTGPTFRGLKTFKEVHGDSAPERSRSEEIYQAPLLLIPQAPGEDRSTPKSFLSREQSVCYDQSMYGYTGGRHPDPEISVGTSPSCRAQRALSLLGLVSSSRIGASWRTFIKEDLDAFPFPDVSKMTEVQRLEIEECARTLDAGLPRDWSPLDSLRITAVVIKERVVL
jgi:hypothetical protein